MLEFVKIPLLVLYLGCVVFMREVKHKKQRRTLALCAVFMGVLIAL